MGIVYRTIHVDYILHCQDLQEKLPRIWRSMVTISLPRYVCIFHATHTNIGPVLYIKLCRNACTYGFPNITQQTIVLFNLSSTSRSSQYFEDPLTFKPERWNRESAEFSAFSSLPFGFGPRSCYGKGYNIAIV